MLKKFIITSFVFTVIFSLSLSNLHAEENLSNTENQNEENDEYIDEEKDLEAATSEEEHISDESTDNQNANDEDKVTDENTSETDEELNNRDSDEDFNNNHEETSVDEQTEHSVNEEKTSSEEESEENLVKKQAETYEQQTEVNSEEDELDVIELKENLVKLGFANWDNPDDQLDEETKATLSEFQSYYQLNVTGEPTEETLAKIDALLSTSLQNGYRSEEAKIMKEKLVKLSFANWSNPTTYYGSETESAVKEFQNYYGLVVNGIGDEVTLNKLNEILSTPLQSGYHSEEAKILKEKLVFLDFADWDNPNTFYASQTEAAVKQLQSKYGLKAHGIADEITLDKVEELISMDPQKGLYRQDVIDLKQKLVRLDFEDWSNPTTYFGSETEAAVESFQAYYGLQITGIANEATLNKLDEILASPLQNGYRTEEAKVLKEKLVFLDFADWDSPNTLYGSETEAAVKQLQSRHGLRVHGIADGATLAKVEELMSMDLQKGLYRQDVIGLKEKLVQLDFEDWKNPTTYFGPETEAAVKSFQTYYGLQVDGIAGEATLNKIEEILSNPLQKGYRSEEAKVLKEKLVFLDFADWDNPNTLYGSETEAAVRQLQSRHGLRVHGIADEATLAKVEELMSMDLQKGLYRQDVIELKEKLVSLSFENWSNPTTYFGSETEAAVKSFQAYFGLEVTGIADEATLNKLDEILTSPLQNGKRSEAAKVMKEKLVILGFADWDNPTTLYASQTEAAVKDFQAYYGLKVHGIGDEVTLEKIEEIISSPLQKGNRSEEARVMKEKLVTLGFADWDSPTTLYGSETENAVKWFQEHFDLVVNGIGDEVTLGKIDEILNSPLQSGNRSEEAKAMKEKLNTLGYADWDNPTTYYGSETEAAVKAFQADQQLPVSGIADYKTLQVIDALYDNFEDGYLEYNYSFDYLISQQMNRNPQTDLYRNDDGYVHGDYINILSETILITGDGVNIRSGPGFSYSVIASGNRGTTFEYTDEVQGDSHAGSRIWYKGKLNGKTAYVHSSLADITMQGEVTATNLNVRETPNGHSYGMISNGTKVSIIDESGSWYKISYNKTWRNAKESDVRDQANPDIEENDINQHLLLTERAGATSSELNQYLSGKGTLDGEGSAFIEAAIKHDINEAYLISHAVHETGHGTSPLAKGIWVDSNGNPVSNQSNPPSGATKVYNMFGIAAFDGQEYVSGSKYAYQQGWTSPKKAIIGGAEWIANKYIYGQYNQNTVYKMRWNPENPGVHQYATDIGWALKQTSTINYIYNYINDPNSTKYSIVEFK